MLSSILRGYCGIQRYAYLVRVDLPREREKGRTDTNRVRDWSCTAEQPQDFFSNRKPGQDPSHVRLA